VKVPEVAAAGPVAMQPRTDRAYAGFARWGATGSAGNAAPGRYNRP